MQELVSRDDSVQYENLFPVQQLISALISVCLLAGILVKIEAVRSSNLIALVLNFFQVVYVLELSESQRSPGTGPQISQVMHLVLIQLSYGRLLESYYSKFSNICFIAYLEARYLIWTPQSSQRIRDILLLSTFVLTTLLLWLRAAHSPGSAKLPLFCGIDSGPGPTISIDKIADNLNAQAQIHQSIQTQRKRKRLSSEIDVLNKRRSSSRVKFDEVLMFKVLLEYMPQG